MLLFRPLGTPGATTAAAAAAQQLRCCYATRLLLLHLHAFSKVHGARFDESWMVCCAGKAKCCWCSAADHLLHYWWWCCCCWCYGHCDCRCHCTTVRPKRRVASIQPIRPVSTAELSCLALQDCCASRIVRGVLLKDVYAADALRI